MFNSQLRWWLSCIAVFLVAVLTFSKQVNSQPQINLLIGVCSMYNASDTPHFLTNLNRSFSDLRGELLGGRHFATTTRPVYAMVQCRNYMSTRDCVACYDAAVVQSRKCAADNGAHVIYDGCNLRYESNSFYEQPTLPGSGETCGNRTAPHPSEFTTAAQKMLQNLQLATPRIQGFYAAITQPVNSGTGNLTIYGMAQCAETLSRTSCQLCLNTTQVNIVGCLPSADGRAFDAACIVRYSVTPFFGANQTVNIEPFLGPEGGGSSSSRNAIIGGAAGSAGLVLILIALFLWYKFSRKTRKSERDDILGATELQGPNRYNYKDLKTATANFSEENKLGEGGFGDVYKGTLKNGNIVAVKRLDMSYRRVKADFETEVRLISNVHHRNLVRLLGCCTKGSELLLVYEYMPKSSLDRHLYGEKKGLLTWKQRFDIIFGIARGLAYLHEQYHVTIIHRDIKPGNILLDEGFQAKIADFGLARLLPENQTHVSTNFAGTLGYTAPEYAVHGHLSEKVDTYSFGVVILEIISGRRCTAMNVNSDTEYLLAEAWKLYESGTHDIIVDTALDKADYEPEDVKKLVEIALLCMQSPPSTRPTMSEILVMLLRKSEKEMRAPNQPSSFVHSGNFAVDMSFAASSDREASTATSQTHFTGR